MTSKTDSRVFTTATAMVDTDTLCEAIEQISTWQRDHGYGQGTRITWENMMMHIIASLPAMEVGFSWDARTASTRGDAVLYSEDLLRVAESLRNFGDEHTLITQSSEKGSDGYVVFDSGSVKARLYLADANERAWFTQPPPDPMTFRSQPHAELSRSVMRAIIKARHGTEHHLDATFDKKSTFWLDHVRWNPNEQRHVLAVDALGGFSAAKSLCIAENKEIIEFLDGEPLPGAVGDWLNEVGISNRTYIWRNGNRRTIMSFRVNLPLDMGTWAQWEAPRDKDENVTIERLGTLSRLSDETVRARLSVAAPTLQTAVECSSIVRLFFLPPHGRLFVQKGDSLSTFTIEVPTELDGATDRVPDVPIGATVNSFKLASALDSTRSGDRVYVGIALFKTNDGEHAWVLFVDDGDKWWENAITTTYISPIAGTIQTHDAEVAPNVVDVNALALPEDAEASEEKKGGEGKNA